MKTANTTKHISRRLRRFARATEAVSALEYAVLIGVVAVAVGAALVTFSGDVQTAITTIGDTVSGIKVDGVTNPTADTSAG